MQTAPVYSPSTCRFHPQKRDAAVRGEPLALEEAEKTDGTVVTSANKSIKSMTYLSNTENNFP